MTLDPNNLIWIDLEMTGLDTVNDSIIEIATIMTDAQLNILAEGPVLAIHQPDELLNGMDEWNTRQHGKSGLTERVRKSTLTEADAEKQTIEFLSEVCAGRGFTHVWQQHLSGSPFYGALHAGTGSLLSLPQS